MREFREQNLSQQLIKTLDFYVALVPIDPLSPTLIGQSGI